MKPASSLYHLNRFFAIKGINRQHLGVNKLVVNNKITEFTKMLSLCLETVKNRGPIKKFAPGPLAALGAPDATYALAHAS